MDMEIIILRMAFINDLVKKYCNIVVLFLLLGCTNTNKVNKDTNVNIDVVNNVGFQFMYAKNGISVKLIPIEDSSYTFEVSIANHVDTLNYYLNCETKHRGCVKIGAAPFYNML